MNRMTRELEVDQNVLELSNVTLGYPGVIAIEDVSFSVRRGEFIGVIGPNGSGKSTIIKGILGLIPLLQGDIKILSYDRSQIRRARQRIGYVPQKNRNEVTFPALVKEVVLMGLYAQIGWFRRPNKHHRVLVDEALDRVGMLEYRDRNLGDLSGGQQQRVMIARAIVSRPDLLLLDEPTAAVDISAQYSILELLNQLNREHHLTILMVTHDVNEIVHFADGLLLFDRQLVKYGPPSDVLTREVLVGVYGDRVFVYDHDGHPHLLVGDFSG